MLLHDQWKTVMMDAVTAVHLARGLTLVGARRLRASVLTPIDPDRMKNDMIFRTDGVVRTNKAERINGIAEEFHQLNRGRDGG